MESNKGEIIKWTVIGTVSVGAILLVYFGILKPILDTVGITDSKEDKDDTNNAQKLEGEAAFGSKLSNDYPQKVTMSDTKAQQLALQIYMAKGSWLGWDDEDSVIAAIRDCQTTYNLSKLAFVFNRTYSKDLLGYMKTFMNDDQLSDAYQAIKNFNK